jgi:hypothetical protein
VKSWECGHETLRVNENQGWLMGDVLILSFMCFPSVIRGYTTNEELYTDTKDINIIGYLVFILKYYAADYFIIFH